MKSKSYLRLPAFAVLLMSLAFPVALSAKSKEKLVVVALGDSFFSGEGNPDRDAKGLRPAKWLVGPYATECHRSKKSPPHMLYRMLKKWNKRADSPRKIVYKSFACTGGEITEGLLHGAHQKFTDFVGRRLKTRVNKKVPSQIKQASRWLKKKGLERVDILLLSIGGNNIGFSTMVALCFITPTKNCIKRAKEMPKVKNGILTLAKEYEKLNEELVRALNPKHVFIREYPDMTRNEDGGFCAGKKSMKLFSSQESKEMFGLTTKLNDIMKRASKKHGWEYVSGITKASKPHGFCAKNPWIRRMGPSFKKQRNHLGTLHPTAKANKDLAKRLFAAIRKKLE